MVPWQGVDLYLELHVGLQARLLALEQPGGDAGAPSTTAADSRASDGADGDMAFLVSGPFLDAGREALRLRGGAEEEAVRRLDGLRGDCAAAAQATRSAAQRESADYDDRMSSAGLVKYTGRERWMRSKKLLGTRGLMLAKYWGGQRTEDRATRSEFFEDYGLFWNAHRLGGLDGAAAPDHQTAHGASRAAREAYILGCLKTNLVPEPLIRGTACHHAAFGEQMKPGQINLNLSNFGIGDDRAVAVAESFKSMAKNLFSVNISNNRLSAPGLVKILNRLDRNTPVLESFDCSRNRGAAATAQTGSALARMVESAWRLETLACADVGLSARSVALLLHAPENLTYLRILDLSSNQLGADAAVSVAAVLAEQSCALQTLDFGWNDLRNGGARALGDALKGNSTLKKLGLAYCSVDDVGGVALAVGIRKHPALVTLDLCWNRVGPRAALVFAHTLSVNFQTIEQHAAAVSDGRKTPPPPPLKFIDFGGNPLGMVGGRALIRRTLMGLKTRMNLHKCAIDTLGGGGGGRLRLRTVLAERAEAAAAAANRPVLKDDTKKKLAKYHLGLFDMDTVERDSPYKLDMNDPYDIAVAVEVGNAVASMQARLVVSQSAGGAATSSTVQFDEDSGSFVDDHGAQWFFPDKGTVTLHYRRAKLALLKSHRAPTAPDVLENAILMLAAAQTRLERSSALLIVSKELFVTTAQLEALVRAVSLRATGESVDAAELVIRLWPRVLDEANKLEMMKRLYPDAAGQEHLIKLFHANTLETFAFCEGNCCGHWKLEVGQAAHRAVLGWIADVAALEVFHTRAAGAADTSQNGDRSCFRNEVVDGVAMTLTEKSLRELLELDCAGVIEFDFVSTARPPPEAPMIDRETYTDLRRLNDDFCAAVAGGSPKIEDDDAVSAPPPPRAMPRTSLVLRVRLATLACCVSAEDVLHLYDALAAEAPDRRLGPDLIVVLFPRVRDLENFKLVLDHLPAAVVIEVARRIGWLNLASPFRLDYRFQLDLRQFDNRVLAHMLLTLATVESVSSGASLKEDLTTEINAAALYQRLGSFVRQPTDAVIKFEYRNMNVQWTQRCLLLKGFLCGIEPVRPQVYTIDGFEVPEKLRH